MGCDIHMYVEKRTATGWHEVPGADVYNVRNYNLFAILAGVRNGVGFAGCDTGDRFEPISEPRGLPPDVSTSVRKESDDYGIDGHSHSWLTLAELQACDWTRGNVHRGWVDPQAYIVFREKGKPSEWCGAVSGRLVRHITNEQMDAYVAAGMPADGLSRYTQVSWSESYATSCGSFIDVTLPALAKFGRPEDVRMVFWFDN